MDTNDIILRYFWRPFQAGVCSTETFGFSKITTQYIVIRKIIGS